MKSISQYFLIVYWLILRFIRKSLQACLFLIFVVLRYIMRANLLFLVCLILVKKVCIVVRGFMIWNGVGIVWVFLLCLKKFGMCSKQAGCIFILVMWCLVIWNLIIKSEWGCWRCFCCICVNGYQNLKLGLNKFL